MGFIARLTVHLQAVGLLESDDRQAGLHAKVAVRLALQIAQADQAVLQILYRVADSAYPQVGGRCIALGIVAGQGGQGVGTGHAVGL